MALASGVKILPDNLAIHIVKPTQSNNNARGEVRRLKITTWPVHVTNCYYYVKTDYTSADNGFFRSCWAGGPNWEEPNEAARTMFGDELILASKLRALFGKDTPIYITNAAEGGTFIVQRPGGQRDWQEASGECFDRCINGMYRPAVVDIETAHPTRTIFTIVPFQGGESESIEGGAALAAFPAGLESFFQSMNNVDQYLANALWLFTKIHYNITANETILNGYIEDFVNAHPDRTSWIDISDKPRKVDLTLEEKAGEAPSGSDDPHTSWIGQEAKGIRNFVKLLNLASWPDRDVSERTSHTGFDFAQFVQPGHGSFRLSFARDNMTITPGGGTPGEQNTITDVLDILGLNDWTVTGELRLKVQGTLACAYFPIGATIGASRIVSPTLLSNSIFGTGIFTVGAWVKFAPSIAGTNPDQAIFSTTNVYAGVRSQFLCYKTNSGTILVNHRANSSTVASAETGVVLNTTLNEGDNQFHFVVVTSTGNLGHLSIYFDGVLAATTAYSGLITPSNFNNAVNGIVFGQRQTAASTYDFGAMNYVPEAFGYGNIALSADNILAMHNWMNSLQAAA